MSAVDLIGVFDFRLPNVLIFIIWEYQMWTVTELVEKLQEEPFITILREYKLHMPQKRGIIRSICCRGNRNYCQRTVIYPESFFRIPI